MLFTFTTNSLIHLNVKSEQRNDKKGVQNFLWILVASRNF